MSDMTNAKVTDKKRLNRAVATPIFGGPSAQKFSWGRYRPSRGKRDRVMAPYRGRRMQVVMRNVMDHE